MHAGPKHALAISIWDSLLVVEVYQSKAGKILTEDLNHGQVMEGILIKNPFIIPAESAHLTLKKYFWVAKL